MAVIRTRYSAQSRGTYSQEDISKFVDQFLFVNLPQRNEIEENGIALELALFHKIYHNTVDIIVPDNCMSPRYREGDHVAGRRYFTMDLKKTVGLDCIVQTEKGDMLVRTIKQISKAGKYCLSCLNPENKEKILYETGILFAAPIIWMRRKCPISGAY